MGRTKRPLSQSSCRGYNFREGGHFAHKIMTRASIISWKTRAPPTQRAPLGFAETFTDIDGESIMQGFIPSAMEDKWFICFDDEWLLFHRSWSGFCIYGLRLERSPDGLRVSESWVNRDPNQQSGTDVEYDRKLVRFLIDAFLLRRPDCRFPMPSNVKEDHPAGILQHHLVGRAYPEDRSNPSNVPNDG